MVYLFTVVIPTLYRNRVIMKEASMQLCNVYSKSIYLLLLMSMSASDESIHLMTYCIPDIIVCDKQTGKPSMVIDAKYKPDGRPVRADSHQLLSYVLLTGVKMCGFIFPGEVTRLKRMESTQDFYIPLSAEPVQYYELIMGNDGNADEIKKVLS
jgi:hypothetical protein